MQADGERCRGLAPRPHTAWQRCRGPPLRSPPSICAPLMSPSCPAFQHTQCVPQKRPPAADGACSPAPHAECDQRVGGRARARLLRRLDGKGRAAGGLQRNGGRARDGASDGGRRARGGAAAGEGRCSRARAHADKTAATDVRGARGSREQLETPLSDVQVHDLVSVQSQHAGVEMRGLSKPAPRSHARPRTVVAHSRRARCTGSGGDPLRGSSVRLLFRSTT